MFSNKILLEICPKFMCNICDYVTDKKITLDKHLLSIKHKKLAQINKNQSTYANIKPTLCPKYNCNLCDYSTSKKSSFDNHILSIKHKNKQIVSIIPIMPITKFNCILCNKTYKDNSGLWRHSKKNHDSKNNFKKEFEDIVLSDNDIINMLITENSELKNMIITENSEFKNMILEIVKSGQLNNTINNNSNNNTFNIQFYLNDTCKDAVNLLDFVDSLQVKLTDLEATAHLGYSEGVSRIFINGLNELDASKRPIQCSDLKRETLYIKDQNEWTKEDPNNSHLSNAIKVVSKKNVEQIFEWQKKYPEYNDPESKQSDRYMEMISNIMPSSGTEQEKNMNKIIKNITKEVVIDKNV